MQLRSGIKKLPGAQITTVFHFLKNSAAHKFIRNAIRACVRSRAAYVFKDVVKVNYLLIM